MELCCFSLSSAFSSVVHGFSRASYRVKEGESLDIVFPQHVKGVMNVSEPILSGTIICERDTAGMLFPLKI